MCSIVVVVVVTQEEQKKTLMSSSAAAVVRQLFVNDGNSQCKLRLIDEKEPAALSSSFVKRLQ